jgi:hypothetical protein
MRKGKELLENDDHACKSCASQKSLTCSSCDGYQKEIKDLKNTLAKFTIGRDNLNILLGKQICHFKKATLGYNPNNQKKLYKNFCFFYHFI